MREFEYTRKEGESDYDRSPEWLTRAFGKKITPLIHEKRVGDIMAVIGPAAHEYVELMVKANDILNTAMSQLRNKGERALGNGFLEVLFTEHRKENRVEMVITKPTGEKVVLGKSTEVEPEVIPKDETEKDLHNRLMKKYRTKTMHPDDHNTMLVISCCESLVVSYLTGQTAPPVGLSLTSLWAHINQSLTHVDEDWEELLPGTLCLNGWVFTADDCMFPTKAHPIWIL